MVNAVEDDDELLDDISEAYNLALCNRYLQDRTATPKIHDYVLNYLFTARNHVQAGRADDPKWIPKSCRLAGTTSCFPQQYSVSAG
ncbi:hypothetical protein PsorP6_003950 [Peronosclerospora sorghi]|uniref:Uncharacterized protein n=1 Tax=Peronosclerospora sorghi TaxID=230839 RepID=A0ACC0VPC5_9STRA|nr:hypothetical protein PsorP6_003950 [Peronosclerospora sorghi]